MKNTTEQFSFTTTDEGFIITKHEISDSDIGEIVSYVEFTHDCRDEVITLPPAIKQKTRSHVRGDFFDTEQMCLAAIRKSFIDDKHTTRKSIAASHNVIDIIREKAEADVEIELKIIQSKKDKIANLKDQLILVANFIED